MCAPKVEIVDKHGWKRHKQINGLSFSLIEYLVNSSENVLGEGLEHIAVDAFQLGPHIPSHLSQW